MRTEGIGNKILLIVMLCAGLGLFLYLRPLLSSPEPAPTLVDRIPESTILGRFHVLDVARETSSMLYAQKIPFRDLISAEFLLSQGKSFGLDVQKPGYFFSDEEGEWGTFLSVIDSSKIEAGVTRLKEFTTIRDTVIHKRKLHFMPNQNMYLFYDKTYIFLYHGNKMKRRLGYAMFAKHGEAMESWKKFEALTTFKNEKLVVFASSGRLKEMGIDYGLFSHDSDSLSFKLKTYIKAKRPLNFKLKDPDLGLEETPNMEKLLNIHVDITEFRKNREHPLYRWIAEMGRKVSFPTDEFFAAWEGDLAFKEGGIQMVKEQVIETAYDEEFNLTEVRRTKLVPVPGFALLISVNNKSFINTLFAKGIITKQDAKYRFLFSPPLKMDIRPGYIAAYSSDQAPVIAKSKSSCSGLWNYQGTKVAFRIDSLTTNEVFGSIEFPVNRLLRKSKFF